MSRRPPQRGPARQQSKVRGWERVGTGIFMLVVGLVMVGLTWHAATGPMCGEDPNPCASFGDRLAHRGSAKVFLVGTGSVAIGLGAIPWGLWEVRRDRRR